LGWRNRAGKVDGCTRITARANRRRIIYKSWGQNMRCWEEQTTNQGVYVWNSIPYRMVVGIREGYAEPGDGWIVIKRKEWDLAVD